MGSGSLKSIYWIHRGHNYNLISHLRVAPLEKRFTLFRASSLNSGHSETQFCSGILRMFWLLSLLWKHVFDSRCCGNMFSEAVTPEWESCVVGCIFVGTCLAKPLPSYSRIFWLQYSGFQAARHIYFNCKWVFTWWQWYYSKTQHTNNTHDTK
jgi:hypothetical protein